MPSTVIHMAVAKRFFELADISDCKYQQAFTLGSIIPDVKERDEKYVGHFFDEETRKKFVRKPTLSMFLEKYQERLKEPFVMGYFCHLLTDTCFIDVYWKKHFRFFDSQMVEVDLFDKVKKVMVDNEKVYDREWFFSGYAYYGDYDLINSYYIKTFHLKRVESLFADLEINSIDEIDFDNEKNQLEALFDKAFCETEKLCGDLGPEALSNSILKPKTLIFNIADLDALIEEAAQITYKQYSRFY